MKVEFLKGLNLDEDTIQKIQAESGKGGGCILRLLAGSDRNRFYWNLLLNSKFFEQRNIFGCKWALVCVIYGKTSKTVFLENLRNE